MRRCQSARFVSPAWPTTTPFGVPVEPEVKITYAGSAGEEGAGGAGGGASIPSTHRISDAAPASLGASACVVSVTRAPASAIAKVMRASGCAGSSATYAAPARSTASAAITFSIDRGRHSATNDPRRTPRAVSAAATSSARRSSAPYESARAPSMTAGASGWNAAVAATIVWTGKSGRSIAVRFSSVRSSLRSPAPITGRSSTRALGSSAIARQITESSPAIRSAVACSKRSVAYSSDPASPSPVSVSSRTRSNFAVPLSIGTGVTVTPGIASAPDGAFWSTNIT